MRTGDIEKLNSRLFVGLKILFCDEDISRRYDFDYVLWITEYDFIFRIVTLLSDSRKYDKR